MAASRSRIMRAAPRGIEKHSRAGIYARGGRHRWAANLKMTTQMKSFATFRLMLNLLSKPYALIKHAALCFYQSSFRADKAPADKARGFMYAQKQNKIARTRHAREHRRAYTIHSVRTSQDKAA
tara:strand:+ start:139 stop:510 length:372 start_codon:yes stop_codon:yes gene_type:complete